VINEVIYEGYLSRIIKLYDDLFFREGNLKARHQCNCGIVELDNSVAIIDYTEQNPDEEIFEEAEGLLHKPVKYILLTHAHDDHVDGFKSLHRKDISIIARQSGIEQLHIDGYNIPPVHASISEDTTILLDGFEFRLQVPQRVSHSPWDMLVGIPKYSVVFTGDLVVVQKDMYFHSSYIAGWRQTVDELIESDWKYLARGHGSVIGHEYLNDAALYLKVLEEVKNWQKEHDEEVDEASVSGTRRGLSPTLASLTGTLLKYVDAANVARQINQLSIRTRAGF
jgi:glyoxylase-like metal-dependent hydrolase (beta-lactamase superfamily II)